MIYFKPLPNLPPPPAEILSSIDINLDPETSVISSDYVVRDRYVVQNNQRVIASKFYMLNLGTKWTDWVHENISRDIIHTGAAYRKFFSSSSGIHTDGSREHTLLWPITTGGDNTVINFYQDPSKTLIQEYAQDYERDSELNLLNSFPSPTKCWYYIYGRVLHSVENMSSNRVQIQIGLKSLPKFI